MVRSPLREGEEIINVVNQNDTGPGLSKMCKVICKSSAERISLLSSTPVRLNLWATCCSRPHRQIQVCCGDVRTYNHCTTRWVILLYKMLLSYILILCSVFLFCLPARLQLIFTFCSLLPPGPTFLMITPALCSSLPHQFM